MPLSRSLLLQAFLLRRPVQAPFDRLLRSERRVAGWLMDKVDGAWLRLNNQGCHMNRDPRPAIDAAGLAIERIERFQVFSAGLPAFPLLAIHAVRT